MPKIPTRKRQKHVKTHGHGKKKKKDGDCSEGDSNNPLEEPCSSVETDGDGDQPLEQGGTAGQPPRPESAASVASAAESVALDFCDDIPSSPDPSVASPLLSDNSMDPLSLDQSEDCDPFQLSGTVSPDSVTYDTSDAGESSNFDFISPPSSPFKVPLVDTGEPSSTPTIQTSRLQNQDLLLRQVKNKIEIFLRNNCITMVQDETLNILFLSRTEDKVTQRQLSFKCDGIVRFKVHCKSYPLDNHLKHVLPAVCLNSNNVGYFADRVVQIMNVVHSFEVCAGVSNIQFKDVWSECERGEVDKNPYRESRFQETFRSLQCFRLVGPRQWRCPECSRLLPLLKRKAEMAMAEEVHPNTANVYLSKQQTLEKLEVQKKKIDATKRQVKRLKERVEALLDAEGVEVDEGMSNDFKSVLESQNLTEAQSLFLEQQVKAANVKGARGRRWHPAMIRFALSLFMKSPAAYGAMYDSGMLILPSRRTLFDYSHFKPVHDGIDYEVIESVSKRVASMVQNDREYSKYHVLMCDEMYISKNLVYKKSTGKIIGYVSVDEVQSELAALQEFLEDPTAQTTPQIASKVLTFLIKGVSNNVKEAVASYAVDQLSKEQLYRWTWELITKLERAGIAIVAFTSDGSSINRAFIKMNKPATKDSSVIFDTVNKAAPDRCIYFIADVPHLLKTIRNSFLTSSDRRYYSKTTGKYMLRRRLEKSGQKIVWSTIVRLYHHQKDKTLRLCPKLNVHTVFLNGYSKMKVKYAAHILSRSVAQLLENLKWEGTEETVKFIRLTNDFFDMLNGAHSQQGVRSRNDNLLPYCKEDDHRFSKLADFEKYLLEWKAEAESASAANTTLDTSTQKSNRVQENDVDDPEPLDDEELTQDPASVKQMPRQTLEGISMTIRGFTAAVKFLLQAGTKFVNGRVFCQDPLEQFFSKQRSRCGGSTNPNFDQVLNNQRSIHLQGQLGTRRSYKGNTEEQESSMTISTEPLQKRKRSSSATIGQSSHQ